MHKQMGNVLAPDCLLVPSLPLEHLGNQHPSVREAVHGCHTTVELWIVSSGQIVKPAHIEVAVAHCCQRQRQYRLHGCDYGGLQKHVMEPILG
jgi:hypothetical protein